MQDEDAGEDKFTGARRAMVEEQVRKRGIASPRVLEALLMFRGMSSFCRVPG